jgi:SAM-dependent methyltransferase
MPKPFRPARPRRWRHPNERPENQLVYALEETVWTYAAARYGRGTLLDVGCGEKPLEPIFASHVVEHVGVDHHATLHGLSRVDIVASAYNIPLPATSVDTIVLSAVLEHLERPQDALDECYRLLRPGGNVLVTTPLFWHLHEAPRDFFRYTPYGLRHLLETAGFDVIEIRPYAGVWTTIATEMSYALRKYRRGPMRILVGFLTAIIQRLGSAWDQVDYQPAFSYQHLAVGKKT